MQELIQIDLHKILRERVPKGKLIPGFLISGLEKIVHQDELNAVLKDKYPATGSEFAQGIYDYFGISIEVEGIENIPDKGKFIFASNHPLGGLDGIGLITVLGKRYGDDGVRFMVNDMLMNVAPLRTVFLPINKYGSQGREAAVKIREAFESDMQMVVFPAGLVSRLGSDNIVQDLKWQKSFITKAIEFKRDIIPVRFVGLNRRRFYNIAKWRKKLGLKVNVEQALLPAELCAAKGAKFKVIFGKPVSWQSLAKAVEEGKSPLELAARIRHLVYAMKP